LKAWPRQGRSYEEMPVALVGRASSSRNVVFTAYAKRSTKASPVTRIRESKDTYRMKIQINTNTTTKAELLATAAMLTTLANAKTSATEPGLDIAPSHEPIDIDPSRVMVYTSTDGAEMVGDYLNTSDVVDQVVTKTVDKPKPTLNSEIREFCEAKADAKEKKADLKAIKAKLAKIKEDQEGWIPVPKADVDELNGRVEIDGPSTECVDSKPPNPLDPRKLVETVLNVKPEVEVKTELVETKGTVDEVIDDLQEAPIASAELKKEIRALNLKAAKYGKAEVAKDIVRQVCGGPVKLSEITKRHAETIVDQLHTLVKGAEDNGG